MGLFRSRRSNTSGGPSIVPLEDYEHADESTNKADTVAAVRETSFDKSKSEEDTSAATTEAEDESKYPTGPKLWLLVLGLCLAIWVIALDNSSKLILSMVTARNVLVPRIANDVQLVEGNHADNAPSLVIATASK